MAVIGDNERWLIGENKHLISTHLFKLVVYHLQPGLVQYKYISQLDGDQPTSINLHRQLYTPPPAEVYIIIYSHIL